MNAPSWLFALGICLHAAAAVSCDISYEVLTYDRNDAGPVTPPPPNPCDCAEQEICVAGSCVSLPPVSTIATGDRHTCRISQGQLWCWGDNASDQLGLADDAPDVVMRPERAGSIRNDWFAVAAGSRHTCALRSPGVLRCWGDDSQGQLGNSSGRMREQARVPWSDFTQLKCGGNNCCALRSGGALYCWGGNQDGNLGIGSADTGSVAMPTPVSGEQIFLRALSVGKSHSCAIASDRTLWCWGSNAVHQLGLADVDKVLVPTQVGEDHDWLWIATGGSQTCGVRKGNVLYCWGDNSAGQVGIARIGPDDELVVTEEPVAVTTATDWVRVAAGDVHTCAIKREQPLSCWGRGDQGQLGLSDVDVIESPARVHETLRFRELALGAAHSCGIDATPQLGMYCWGQNDRGQLGSGSTESSVLPVRLDQF